MPEFVRFWRPEVASVDIDPTLQLHHYRLRALRALVSSCADAFVFVNDGETIWYVPQTLADTPWQVDVGRTIETHFQPELRLYCPPGEWRLGMTGLEAV